MLCASSFVYHIYKFTFRGMFIISYRKQNNKSIEFNEKKIVNVYDFFSIAVLWTLCGSFVFVHIPNN